LPDPEDRAQVPAIIVPTWLAHARVFADLVSEGPRGQVVETRLLLLEPIRPERRARVDELMGMVAQQLLWRSGRPPFSLTLALYEKEGDAEAERQPVAFCALESE